MWRVDWDVARAEWTSSKATDRRAERVANCVAEKAVRWEKGRDSQKAVICWNAGMTSHRIAEKDSQQMMARWKREKGTLSIIR